MPSWRYQLAAIVALVSTPLDGVAQSTGLVQYGQSNRLIYQMDHRGDRLLDFSSAGYEFGSDLPNAAEVVDSSRVVNVAPIPGDNRSRIQAAIDRVSDFSINANGFRGVVQLAAGQYDISDTLEIGASGVILRGVGDDDSVASNTILRSTTTNKINMIEIGNFDQYANNLFSSGSAVAIAEKTVPAGVTSFRVADTSPFGVGDWVNVKRTPTQAWFDNVTSYFPNDPSGENFGWNTSEDRFTFQQERIITRIEGDRVFINAPLSHSIDPQSNGSLEHYTDRRVSHVGVERIRGTTVFDASETGVYSGRTQLDDEDHAESFVVFAHAENSWARDVTGEHLSDSAVVVGGPSRSITVEDARYVEPVSVVTGGQRYAFNMNGGQYVLMQDLEADSARRAFINNSTFNGFNRGPNVFLDSVATRSFVRSGPHANYSTGALYDNISDDGGYEARQAFGDNPVHGWRGGHSLIWNSTVSDFQIASPPGANNYAIGATGDPEPPSESANAIIDSFGTRIEFNDPNNPLDSLYVAQKIESERFSDQESREYWIGDFDELQPGDADDQQPVDPAWLAAIDNLSSAFHSAQPVTTFDDDTFGRRVPFTIDYDLATDEQVFSAVLTIGMKKRGGASSDDDLLWLDSTENPLGFSSEEWGPTYEGSLQVLTLELIGDLEYLQDGQLNGVLSNNRPVDWVHLRLHIGDRIELPGDFNSDGVVDAADYTLWRDTQGSSSDFRADANGDKAIDASDLAIWRDHFGETAGASGSAAVPEPAAAALAALAGLLLQLGGSRRLL